jgi:hypothetical protein
MVHVKIAAVPRDYGRAGGGDRVPGGGTVQGRDRRQPRRDHQGQDVLQV